MFIHRRHSIKLFVTVLGYTRYLINNYLTHLILFQQSRGYKE